jgi:rubrerythrin
MNDNQYTDLYDELMAKLYETMDDTLHSIADAMLLAKQQMADIGGYSQNEINRVAEFVLRDLHSAAGDTHRGELGEWLKFDIGLVENFALDAFWSLADKARVQLTALQWQADLPREYQAGEIASPGTFICQQCGKTIAFKSTSSIPSCPACNHGYFSRV